MVHIRWIPLVERSPDDRQIVIVGRDDHKGRSRNFPAIYTTNEDDGSPAWVELAIDEHRDATLSIHDVRATDFWLPLPAEPPGFNCVDGGWPG